MADTLVATVEGPLGKAELYEITRNLADGALEVEHQRDETMRHRFRVAPVPRQRRGEAAVRLRVRDRRQAGDGARLRRAHRGPVDPPRHVREMHDDHDQGHDAGPQQQLGEDGVAVAEGVEPRHEALPRVLEPLKGVTPRLPAELRPGKHLADGAPDGVRRDALQKAGQAIPSCCPRSWRSKPSRRMRRS